MIKNLPPPSFSRTVLQTSLLLIGLTQCSALSNLFSSSTKNLSRIEVASKPFLQRQIEVHGASLIERPNLETKTFESKVFYLDTESLIASEDFVFLDFEAKNRALVLRIKLSSIGQKIFHSYATEFPDKHLLLINGTEILATFVTHTQSPTAEELRFELKVPSEDKEFSKKLYDQIFENL